MHPITVAILLYLSVCTTSSKVVNYKFAEGNSNVANDCINGAIEKFRKLSCVQFRYHPTGTDAISVVDSGYCSWRDSNKTIHVGKVCINEDTCQRLIGQSIVNERIYKNPIQMVNTKLNCTDKCTINCQNGGKLTNDCQCECGYGFSGDTCDQLSLRSEFSDASCGMITDQKEGIISLSSYPNAAPKGTFCQWLIKANEQETIEFQFIDLDLNSESAMPGQKCADSLSVLGVSNIENPVPCNRESQSIMKRLYRSDGDWLMFIFSTNTWSRAMHKGPVIKYQVISPQSNKEIRSFSNSYSNSGNTSFEFVQTFVAMLLTSIWLKVLS